MKQFDLSLEGVKNQVADVFELQLGLPRERVLAGERFIDLDPMFDSLSLVQAHLFLEEVYETRFERNPAAITPERVPANLDDLVALLLPRLQQMAGQAAT